MNLVAELFNFSTKVVLLYKSTHYGLRLMTGPGLGIFQGTVMAQWC